MRVPSTKLNPKHFLPIIVIIQRNEGNLGGIRKNIHSYLLGASRKKTIGERTAVYALAFPTLRRLNLLRGKGEHIRLSVDGRILINAYETKGDNAYNNKLAKVVLRADRENANVLEAIKELDIRQFGRAEIAIELVKRGVETSAIDDRLTNWLRILKYVRFIDRIDSLHVLNQDQLEVSERDFVDVSETVFVKEVLKAHQKLSKKRRGNPFIPIPEIEQEVCRQFFDNGFTTFDFRERLSNQKGKTIDGFKIVFTKPGSREANGLRIHGEYYYYIAILSR